MGAGCYGYNRDSIHIVTMSTRVLTCHQVNSLLVLCATISKRLQIPAEDFYGHYELLDKWIKRFGRSKKGKELKKLKTCPNHDMMVFRKLLSLFLESLDHRPVDPKLN